MGGELTSNPADTHKAGQPEAHGVRHTPRNVDNTISIASPPKEIETARSAERNAFPIPTIRTM